jgi:hypothetical protein
MVVVNSRIFYGFYLTETIDTNEIFANGRK